MILRIIWFLIPTFFFLTWLWGTLEAVSAKKRRPDLDDLFHQVLFLLVSVLVTLVIDVYVMDTYVAEMLPTSLPLIVPRIFLFPLVTVMLSKFIGPSSSILIDKAPRPSQQRRRR